MAVRTLEAHRLLSCGSRLEILRLLADAGGALTVEVIGAHVGLHANTVREHLDRLLAAGFVSRTAEVRVTRGRPRMLYRLTTEAPLAELLPDASPPGPASAGARAGPGPAGPLDPSSAPERSEVPPDHAVRDQLMRVLLEGYGADDARAAAVRAGRAWAEQHPCGPTEPCRPVADRGTATAQLAALRRHLTELGFEPAVGQGEVLHLLHCPFADLAVDNPDVVCGVHVGLTQGILDRHRGPLSLVDVRPAQHGCVVLLGRRAADEA